MGQASAGLDTVAAAVDLAVVAAVIERTAFAYPICGAPFSPVKDIVHHTCC